MNVYLGKNGKTYVVTFDDDGVVDTVHCDGVALAATNRVVKQILNNADMILRGFIPHGFERAK